MHWNESQDHVPSEAGGSKDGTEEEQGLQVGAPGGHRLRRLRSARVNDNPNRVSVLRPRRRRQNHNVALYALAILGLSTGLASWRVWHLEKSLARMEEAALALTDEIHRMRREVSEALVRGAPTRDVDERDAQALRRAHPEEGEILAQILRLRRERVAWAESANDPQIGFHSAGFVGHVLRETGHTMGFLELASDPGESSLHLFSSLRYKQTPEPGDLVFYPGDIVLFYFQDRSGRPFVIGMTPRGIRAFDPGFAEPQGYREFRFGGRIRS